MRCGKGRVEADCCLIYYNGGGEGSPHLLLYFMFFFKMYPVFYTSRMLTLENVFCISVQQHTKIIDTSISTDQECFGGVIVSSMNTKTLVTSEGGKDRKD